jgi:Fe-S-cluster containining protein
MCGNCCSGPAGYVLFTPEDGAAIAARLGISVERFIVEYTHDTRAGRSLAEVSTPAGLDCVFLDRTSVPGRALCSIYEDRPAQCRTWPFWKSNVSSPDAWARANARCPGINRGALVPPEQVRILRDRVDR